MEENRVFLGVHSMFDGKKIQNDLDKVGVEIDLMSNEETCSASNNCRVTVEVWGYKEDQDEIIKYLRNVKQKELDGLEVNVENLSEVFDPNSDSNICQCCGASLSATDKECPDCGLVYG